MYTKIFKYKKYSAALNKFPVKAKNISDVYHSGFHKWEAHDAKFYSVVCGLFRLIFVIEKVNCCGERG